MARLDSFDVTAFPATWFDITADAMGWMDIDYVPGLAGPAPPPPGPPLAPQPAVNVAGVGGGFIFDPPREIWKTWRLPPEEEPPPPLKFTIPVEVDRPAPIPVPVPPVEAEIEESKPKKKRRRKMRLWVEGRFELPEAPVEPATGPEPEPDLAAPVEPAPAGGLLGWALGAVAVVAVIGAVSSVEPLLSKPSTLQRKRSPLQSKQTRTADDSLPCRCVRCGHRWIARGFWDENIVQGRDSLTPKVCPKCRSPYWNGGPEIH